MLVLECLTRELPWASAVTDARALAWAVTHGDRPEVPLGVPRDLVALARVCWAHDPVARPALDRLLADLSSETGVFRGDTGGGGGVGARSGDGVVAVAAPTPDGRERVSTGGSRHGGGTVALVTDAGARGSTSTRVASGANRRHASPSPRRGDADGRSLQQREDPGTAPGEVTASPKTVVAVGGYTRTISPSPASTASRREGSGNSGNSGMSFPDDGGGGLGGVDRSQKAEDPRDDLALVRRLHGSPARDGVAIRRVSSADSSLSTSTAGCAPAEMCSLSMK